MQRKVEGMHNLSVMLEVMVKLILTMMMMFIIIMMMKLILLKLTLLKETIIIIDVNFFYQVGRKLRLEKEREKEIFSQKTDQARFSPLSSSSSWTLTLSSWEMEKY